MGDEEVLADVLRNPDDVTARLNYALWCDAQPDQAQRTRGDFIRLQIELANVVASRAPVDDIPLRMRIDRLADRWGDEWAGTLRQIAKRFEFHRGFVELVGITAGSFLERAETLFAAAPIRHVTLTEVGPVIEELFASPHLDRIRSLSVEACGLTDRDMFVIARSPRLRMLRWLSVAQNRVTEAGAAALAESPYLEDIVYIAFHGNEFQPNERYSFDNEFVVDSWLPEDGVKLENDAGRRLPWLHHSATNAANTVPDRFALADQKSTAGG